MLSIRWVKVTIGANNTVGFVLCTTRLRSEEDETGASLRIRRLCFV